LSLGMGGCESSREENKPVLAPATPGLSHGFGGDTVAMLSSVYSQVYTTISWHDLCASDQSIRRSGSRKFLYDRQSRPQICGGWCLPARLWDGQPAIHEPSW